MQSKSGNLNNDVTVFEKAINNNKIATTNIDDISNALRLSFLKLGIRAANLPSPEEKSVLIDFIYRNYSNHTPEEIVLAFDLAILGKLDTDVKHYENFTCMYLGSVMGAYRRWAVEQSKMVKPKEMILIDEQRELTDEDWNEWLDDMKNYDLKLIPCAAYDYLVKKGKLVLTNDQKHDYMEKAVNILQYTIDPATKDMYEFLSMKKEGVFSKKITPSLVTISKRLAISDYLKNN